MYDVTHYLYSLSRAQSHIHLPAGRDAFSVPHRKFVPPFSPPLKFIASFKDASESFYGGQKNSSSAFFETENSILIKYISGEASHPRFARCRSMATWPFLDFSHLSCVNANVMPTSCELCELHLNFTWTSNFENWRIKFHATGHWCGKRNFSGKARIGRCQSPQWACGAGHAYGVRLDVRNIRHLRLSGFVGSELGGFGVGALPCQVPLTWANSKYY